VAQVTQLYHHVHLSNDILVIVGVIVSMTELHTH